MPAFSTDAASDSAVTGSVSFSGRHPCSSTDTASSVAAMDNADSLVLIIHPFIFWSNATFSGLSGAMLCYKCYQLHVICQLYYSLKPSWIKQYCTTKKTKHSTKCCFV